MDDYFDPYELPLNNVWQNVNDRNMPGGGIGGSPSGLPFSPPGFPGGSSFPGFPSLPGSSNIPGFPPGQQPGGGEQQGGPPSAPPPSFTPQMQQQQGASTFAVDPGAIRGCLYRNTFVWLNTGRGFWFFPTFVGRDSVAGWRWRGFRWTYYGTDLRRIRNFQCF